MKRLGWSGFLLGLAAAISFAGEQPNILLILADDLGYHDLSCQGATDFKTPNLDRLAVSGVRFADGYVSAPQCGPSRAGLMTGMSQSRFGCLDNSSPVGLPPADVVQTLPEQLKALGYTTGIIGKWHIGSDNKTEGHPTFAGNNPWERGFDYVLTHAAGHSHYYPYRVDGTKWMTDRHLEYRLQYKKETESEVGFKEQLPADTYLTDYFSEQGSAFIQRNAEKPWFLYLSYNAPHTPSVAKADKLKKYAHIKDNVRRNMVAMMDSLDEGIGRVLGTLEKTGQTRETLVFFLSDNGGPTHQNGSRNDPFSGKKGDVHEGGIRVPFMVSWPGTIPGGRVVSDPVISLDILPTSLSAAGVIQVPEIHEGKNLMPWLKQEADCPNEVICWSWRAKAAIRVGSLKETRNGADVKAIDGTDVPGHIFSDLSENPQELEAKALQSPEKKKMLADRLDAWLYQLEQDQKVLIPRATPKVIESVSLATPKRELLKDDFNRGQGPWATRAVFGNVVFADGTVRVSPHERTGQPGAAFCSFDELTLADGDALRLTVDVATDDTLEKDRDLRAALGFSDPAITGDSSNIAVPLSGYWCSLPSVGSTADPRISWVDASGGNQNFFNFASATIGNPTLDHSVSVGRGLKTLVLKITRSGGDLVFSGSLDGFSFAEPLAARGTQVIPGARFNTVGLGYGYAKGRSATFDNLCVEYLSAE